MNGSSSGEMLNLMPARKTRGSYDRSGRRSPDGWQKLSFAYRLRQLVMFALVSKRACHAAAAGVQIDDLAIGDAAKQAQQRARPN